MYRERLHSLYTINVQIQLKFRLLYRKDLSYPLLRYQRYADIGIAWTTVERTLTDLVKSGYIAKVGSGPATAYVRI